MFLFLTTRVNKATCLEEALYFIQQASSKENKIVRLYSFPFFFFIKIVSFFNTYKKFEISFGLSTYYNSMIQEIEAKSFSL